MTLGALQFQFVKIDAVTRAKKRADQVPDERETRPGRNFCSGFGV
jgi:hypothetical protein